MTGRRGSKKAGHWVARDSGNCEHKIAAHEREMKPLKTSCANQKFMTGRISLGAMPAGPAIGRWTAVLSCSEQQVRTAQRCC
ncbi:hypothetical protein, partial [Mesorhizobium sp. M4A.F.Ca.ET.022.05.2.1]|uniref:hypothetical protein n=1 Tax=Mesorhizobium sp. M4A.F.Ca.ET.022.05.2.1 TaxID=2496653 RepID=UPI001AECA0E4